MTEKLALLTRPFDDLVLGERAEALILARDAGREAARGPVDSEELEQASPAEYWMHVVGPAVETEDVPRAVAAAWADRTESGEALADPRVQAFLFGWNESALEILASVRGDHSDHGEVARTLWLLDAVVPTESGG